ncbi:MAG: hypothetical protein AB8B74_14615 [Crocinitomicaceae bacterium]
MKKLLFIGILAMTIASCSKDQKAVKEIEGLWKATSYTVSNGSQTVKVLESTGTSVSFDFTSCKLRKEESCPLSIIARDSLNVLIEDNKDITLGYLGIEPDEELTYTMIEDGTQMEILGDDGDEGKKLYTIKELEAGSLVLENLANGLINTIEFRR